MFTLATQMLSQTVVQQNGLSAQIAEAQAEQPSVSATPVTHSLCAQALPPVQEDVSKAQLEQLSEPPSNAPGTVRHVFPPRLDPSQSSTPAWMYVSPQLAFWHELVHESALFALPSSHCSPPPT